MNICCVCQADGVLEALGQWYCKNHLEAGLLDVAEFVDRVGGYDFVRVIEESYTDEEDPDVAVRPFWNPAP